MAAAAGEDRQALSLQWVYGLSNVPSNVVCLSDTHSDRVAYAAAHTAVIYDKHSGTQTFLQGHCNPITCMQATTDRSVLVTADAGTKAPLLVFWDPASGQPFSTVQQSHAAGVLSMAISADGQHLATLSAAHRDEEAADEGAAAATQEVSVWDISAVTTSSSSSAGQLQPLVTTAVPAGDVQTHIAFHPEYRAELVTNGAKRVLFWRHEQQHAQQEGEGGQHTLSFDCPPFRPTEFQQATGDFVTSVFVPNSTQALTSTVDGDAVVWEREGAPTAQHSMPGRRALKIIRLHGAAITHLEAHGHFVVTGGADGLVRLFDSGMRLCAWFEGINAGPVTCVSFATKGQQATAAVMHMSTLSAPNFVVSTATGSIVAVEAECFNTPDPENPSGSQLLLAAPDSCLSHILAHPLRPELLLLASPGVDSTSSCASSTSTSGTTTTISKGGSASTSNPLQQHQQGQQKAVPTQRLLRWDLVSKSCVVSRQLPPEQRVVQVALARDGSFAVLGCAAGHVAIIKGDSLQETVGLRHTKHEITRMSVSSDGRYVACADASGQVLLYGFLPHKGAYFKWDLVGKFKAHHGDVVGLHFGEAPGGQTRLFSLGSDQRLVEYDLTTCTAANTGLRTLHIRDCVPPGSTGSPCAMCFAPPMPYYSHSSTETLLLVADNAFKIKAYNPDAASSLATATYLGPTFGDPINKLLPFRSVSDAGSTPWLAYSTPECVVGLIKWPLDCEPRCSMGLIAHPGQIRGLVLSFDGRKLITLGTHGIMNVWEVNTAALLPQQQAQHGLAVPAVTNSAANKPDWAQLIGDPDLHEELRDYFCYAQLTTQPLDTAGSFGIDGRVPVEALPDLMRAAGHYPSTADTDSLLAHVKFIADMAPADDTTVCSTSGGGVDADSSSNGSKPAGSFAGGAQRKVAGGAGGVDLDTFLLLYLSHRPVVDFSKQQVEAAFKTLGATTAAGVLSTPQLLHMLQTGGEAMSADELQQVVQVLTGAPEGCGAEEALPEYIRAEGFMTDLLGFAA